MSGVAVAGLLLLLTSCSTDGGSKTAKTGQGVNTGATGNETMESTANLPIVTGAAGAAPVITPATGVAPTSLETKDLIIGTGATALANSTLTVHYTLMAWSTGKVVESSWTGGSPATFPLANVIAGWQQGIPGMKEGGRRLLVIPSSLGYGDAGSGPIGPKETLIFVVDLIKVG